jgi:uncharacterized protein YydD (DUF2326 family)
MPEREEYLVNRIKKLEADLQQAEAATKEIGTLVDALLIQIAKEYGVKVPGGYQMKMPVFDAKALVEKYEVTAEKDDFQYEIRVNRREV